MLTVLFTGEGKVMLDQARQVFDFVGGLVGVDSNFLIGVALVLVGIPFIKYIVIYLLVLLCKGLWSGLKFTVRHTVGNIPKPIQGVGVVGVLIAFAVVSPITWLMIQEKRGKQEVDARIQNEVELQISEFFQYGNQITVRSVNIVRTCNAGKITTHKDYVLENSGGGRLWVTHTTNNQTICPLVGEVWEVKRLIGPENVGFVKRVKE